MTPSGDDLTNTSTPEREEQAGYDLLSELAGVDTYDINLRDHPKAWEALERYRAALASSPAAERTLSKEQYEAMFYVLRGAGCTFRDATGAIERIKEILVLAAPQTEPGAGLSIKQEPKYTVNGHAIVNRASGEEIPADEPVFVFRARDVHAREALEAYAAVLTPGDHRDAVVQRVSDFAWFAYWSPDRMKEPDTAAQTEPGAEQ